MEYKYVELKALKMSEKGPGTIEGYRSTFDIDEGGDLILPGAFRETIPRYLDSGFTAESHDWNFSKAVGFPVIAREDDTGLWVKSQFHSTDDAQNVRIKAKERMDAGKQVGFSFGYSPLDFSFLDAKDYERELPRLVKSSELAFNLAQAKRFPRLRLLKKLEVMEDSIVTAPMNKRASATAVKHGVLSDVSRVDWRHLRAESIRRRMKYLYGIDIEEKSAASLRSESERIRSEAQATLLRLEILTRGRFIT